MHDQYEILMIDPTWERGPEQMGSKNKFWFLRPAESGQGWLFKHRKGNTGEHWAEKIAAEVAQLLKIHHAQVELATFEGIPGSATKSFARDGRSLWHGNQVLAMFLQEYDPQKTFGQSEHTLANVWQVLDMIFVESDAAQRAKSRIAEYVVLDALIGNTDRHHENWGILRKRVHERWRGFIAPSFDHASSLGRELRDERRERFLSENRVGDYAEKGRGGIYWSEDEGRYGPSPLELARRATARYPENFRPALEKLQILDACSIQGIIDRIPDDWMTDSARQFALSLMLYNLAELRRLVP